MEPSEPRALTVDEAIALAILLQKQHHLAEAEQLYAGVLDVAPQHPDALHYSGLLAHQRGRTDEAVNLIGQSLALSPNQADWHSNLGIVLQSNGRLGDAIAEYERAIESTPATPTRTAISASCCAPRAGRRRPRPPTVRRSACVPTMWMPTRTSASCSMA